MIAAPKKANVNHVDVKMIDPLDGALELMYFGLKGLTKAADECMAENGLGRAHHRVIYVIARMDGLSVGELSRQLGVSPQALHKTLKKLRDGGYIAESRRPDRHRFKSLHLTETGRELERRATDLERQVVREAFEQTGKAAAEEWAKVMELVAKHA